MEPTLPPPPVSQLPAPPHAGSMPPPPWQPAFVLPRRPFQSLQGHSTALTWLFIVFTLVALLHASSAASLYLAAEDASGPRWADDLMAQNGLYLLTVMARLGVYITIGIVLMLWLRRALDNLDQFPNPQRRFGPGWAIGAWFVPFANYVIPKQLINDAWRGAAVEGTAGRPWKDVPVPMVIQLWWGFYLVGFAFGTVSLGASSAETPSGLQTNLILELVPLPFQLAAALCAALSIREITRRQHAAIAETWTRRNDSLARSYGIQA